MKRKRKKENMRKINLPEDISKKLKRSQDDTWVFEIEKNKEYSLAYGELKTGEENKKHKLEMKEIYYFIEGKGEMKIEEEIIQVKKESVVIIPKDKKQQLKNTDKKTLKFLMIVNPPYDPKKEQIL